VKQHDRLGGNESCLIRTPVLAVLKLPTRRMAQTELLISFTSQHARFSNRAAQDSTAFVVQWNAKRL
jgi:hypothetical protein